MHNSPRLRMAAGAFSCSVRCYDALAQPIFSRLYWLRHANLNSPRSLMAAGAFSLAGDGSPGAQQTRGSSTNRPASHFYRRVPRRVRRLERRGGRPPPPRPPPRRPLPPPLDPLETRRRFLPFCAGKSASSKPFIFYESSVREIYGNEIKPMRGYPRMQDAEPLRETRTQTWLWPFRSTDTRTLQALFSSMQSADIAAAD
jgi:hypothetical protein